MLSLSQSQKALKRDGVKKPTLAHVIRYVLQRKGVKKVTVPYSFPAGLARELGKLRVRVKVKPGGTYFAQHVGPRSVAELSEFFLGPQPPSDNRSPERARREAERAGDQDVRKRLDGRQVSLD